MGVLVNGQWQDKWYETDKNKGRFIRPTTQFRNWVTADGSAGPSGRSGFKAEADRYHLYVSLACPWAHRTLIFRKLKGLEKLDLQRRSKLMKKPLFCCLKRWNGWRTD